MKTKRFILFLVLLVGVSDHILAQGVPRKVGDTIAGDIPLKLLERRSGIIKSSMEPFRGKWLILDFWETYCMACIAAMPYFDSLNREFNGDLEIVLVTKSNAPQIQKFLNRSPMAKNTNFKFIIQDSLLNGYFPHLIIPHEVWIDPQGTVRAITGQDEVNAQNIRDVMNSSNSKMRQKKENMSWEKESISETGYTDRLLFRSILTSYDANTPKSGWFTRQQSDSSENKKKLDGIEHVYFSNYTPIQLFYHTYMFWKYGASGNLNPNRIIVNVSDSLKMLRYANPNLKIPFIPKAPYLNYKNQKDYYQANWFSYDLSLPRSMPDSIVFSYVFDDLNRYFPIKAKIEKRAVECLVLQLHDNAETKKLLKSNGGRRQNKIDSKSLILKNCSFKEFVSKMIKFKSKPLIDETGIDYNIDLDLDFQKSPHWSERNGLIVNMFPFDEEVFTRQLSKYKIVVKKESRIIDMLIIYD